MTFLGRDHITISLVTGGLIGRSSESIIITKTRFTAVNAKDALFLKTTIIRLGVYMLKCESLEFLRLRFGHRHPSRGCYSVWVLDRG